MPELAFDSRHIQIQISRESDQDVSRKLIPVFLVLFLRSFNTYLAV